MSQKGEFALADPQRHLSAASDLGSPQILRFLNRQIWLNLRDEENLILSGGGVDA
jgi:hypothetical protein